MPQSNPPTPVKVRVTRVGPVIVTDQRRFDAAVAQLLRMAEVQLAKQPEQHPTPESDPITIGATNG